MSLDTKNQLTHANISRPAAQTSTVTSASLDLRDYVGVVTVFQNVGTVSGTSPTLDGKIQDSADDSSFADVTGYTFTQVTASNNSQFLAVDARKVRRYIRYIGTIAGTSPSFGLAVSAHGVKQNQG